MNSSPLHFIISAPRSGSTWLASALNQHPHIFATEHRLFGNFYDLWSNNNGRQAPRITLDAYARAFAIHYFHQQTSDSRRQFTADFIRETIDFLIEFGLRRSGKKIVVDKITPYPGTADFVMQQIREFVPQASIIKLVRDGRDVATSGTFDWLLKDAAGSPRYRYFVEGDNECGLHRFFDDQVLASWAANWLECLTVFDDQPAQLAVRYEDMIDNQASVLEKIFALLDVDSPVGIAEKCANAVTFEKMSGRPAGELVPTDKRRKGVRGDWKNYFTRHDGDIFHSIAGDRLVKEGYETNSSWLSALPEKLSFACGQST